MVKYYRLQYVRDNKYTQSKILTFKPCLKLINSILSVNKDILCINTEIINTKISY